MSDNATIYVPANAAIIEDIKKELRLQGHYLTGALETSLHSNIIHENGGFTLSAEAAGYLEQLEKGIAPEDIRVDSQALEEMTNYVTLRMGYRGSKASQVAYLILRKQAEEGNPTSSSYQYSQTGNRKDVVAETFEKNQQHYGQMVDQATIQSLDNQFLQTKSGTI